MTAATGIWTQHALAERAMPLAGPGSGGNNGSNNSSNNSATISANDFLTLLVTEMQNQDPTADTDPNEYINQLVNVNSLEQLISINQNLSTALGISNSSSNSNSESAASVGQLTAPAAGVAPSTANGAPAVLHESAHKASALGQVQAAAAASAAQRSPSTPAMHGNLSTPGTSAAAERVAQALSGHASVH